MGIELETAPKDLKCTITIQGMEGQDEAKVDLDFDPPISAEHKAAWENSGAGIIVSNLLDKMKKAEK